MSDKAAFHPLGGSSVVLPRPDALSKPLEITSDFEPAGDQPQAIAELTENLLKGERDQVLLGVTGRGKTFTMAHVIQKLQRLHVGLAPTTTLAATLVAEMKCFI